MSQEANRIQKLVERKQALEQELVRIDRELDAATNDAIHGHMRERHEKPLPNRIEFGGE